MRIFLIKKSDTYDHMVNRHAGQIVVYDHKDGLTVFNGRKEFVPVRASDNQKMVLDVPFEGYELYRFLI